MGERVVLYQGDRALILDSVLPLLHPWKHSAAARLGHKSQALLRWVTTFCLCQNISDPEQGFFLQKQYTCSHRSQWLLSSHKGNKSVKHQTFLLNKRNVCIHWIVKQKYRCSITQNSFCCTCLLKTAMKFPWLNPSPSHWNAIGYSVDWHLFWICYCFSILIACT